MAGNTPEEKVRYPIAYQDWRHVTFLHWRYDPDVVAGLLPPGLEPDLVDGAAWVGLTPFLVERFRVPGMPVLPVVSRYPETNLRTYVRDGRGGEGLWFLSLDVESIPTVLAARLGLAVRYFPARMAVHPGASVRYESSRLVGGPAEHRIEVRPGEAVDVLSERDAVLLGRWRAYSRPANRLVQVPVEHEPWPVWTASLDELDQSITRAAGLPEPVGDPLVHYSPGVDARLGPPRLVGGDN